MNLGDNFVVPNVFIFWCLILYACALAPKSSEEYNDAYDDYADGKDYDYSLGNLNPSVFEDGHHFATAHLDAYPQYSQISYGNGTCQYNPEIEGVCTPSVAENHPCYRRCSTEASHKMTCTYDWTLEYYMTMSTACGNCTKSPSDRNCHRPECIAADGVKRVIAVVNGGMPGPSIRVCEGDTVVVNVRNELHEPTSIHWHGLHQKKTQFMDGVPGLTQCAIQPRATFRYEFDTPLGGTYFWHSHSGFQRADGLYGSFVVRKAPQNEFYGPEGQRPLYDFDLAEHEIIIMDWQEEYTLMVFTDSVFGGRRFNPQNALINGKGIPRQYFNQSIDVEHLKRLPPLQELRIASGSRYRFRFISNAIMSCPFEVSIESHNMTVIASDGFDVQPRTVDSLVLYAGERWDVVVRGDQPIGSYWIKFRGLNMCRVNGNFQVAVLNYEGIPNGTLPEPSRFIRSYSQAAPPKRSYQLNPFNINKNTEDYKVCHVSELQSREDDDPEIIEKEHADHQFFLSFDFNPVDHLANDGPHKLHHVVYRNKLKYTPQVNYISFIMPKSPPLIQPDTIGSLFLCNSDDNDTYTETRGGLGTRKGGKNCTAEVCACTHLVKARLGSIVEIILIDKGQLLNASHPFHLHGHSFRVVAMQQLNASTTPEQVRRIVNEESCRNRRSAPIKDTVNVPDGGFTMIRFRADNPGYWYLHCHIEFHVETGMGLVVQVGETDEIQRRVRVPPNFMKCGESTSDRPTPPNPPPIPPRPPAPPVPPTQPYNLPIWVGSPNYFQGRRGTTVKWIIIHAIGGYYSPQQVAQKFQNPASKTSAHYIIGKDGLIVQSVREVDTAWDICCVEAGASPWWSKIKNEAINEATISIEHVKYARDNSDLLPHAQKMASFHLIRDIIQRHPAVQRRWADENGGITGHFSTSPQSRAKCPGSYPFEELFQFLRQDNGGGATMPPPPPTFETTTTSATMTTQRIRPFDGSQGGQTHIVQLTDASFHSLMIQSAQNWLVLFSTVWCSHCKVLKPEYAKAAESLRAQGSEIMVGAIEADQYERINKRYFYNWGYPRIIFFPKWDKTSPIVYRSQHWKAADIAQWARDMVQAQQHSNTNPATSF